jgi:Zn-dependent M28 family amino/carboxypeptidase
MHRISRVLAVAGWAVLASACSEPPSADPRNSLRAEKLLQGVRQLSDDDMQGRGAGTEGEDRAAVYIQSRFEKIGLAPVSGSYLQEARLVGMKKAAERSNLRIVGPGGELEYVSDQTVTYWSTSQNNVVDLEAVPILFVGYGVEAPEYEWDDFKGTDLSGKVLLFLNNDPPVLQDGEPLFGSEARTYYGRWTYKFEQAMRQGAAGAIMIHTTPSASYPFSVVQHSGADETFALDLPNSGYQVDLLGWMDEETSERMAVSMGTSLQGLFEMGSRWDFEPVDTGYRLTAHIETDIRQVTTKNVLGLLVGADPELKEQVIVFSAHYDHLGRREDLEGPDKVFNGAWDNAAGTSAIIQLAEAFSALETPPRRSLLFLACAAEESGSLGSRWFVNSPPFERSRLVADFNIDMPQIFGLTADLAVIGVESNTLGQTLQQVASEFSVQSPDGSEQPIRITGDPNPNAGSFYRSDQVNFAKAGIPSLYLKPGIDYVSPLSFDPKQYEDSHYHQVSDEVSEEWDLSGLQRDLLILFETALRVGNTDEMPRWVTGNEFEEEWKKLHGF